MLREMAAFSMLRCSKVKFTALVLFLFLNLVVATYYITSNTATTKLSLAQVNSTVLPTHENPFHYNAFSKVQIPYSVSPIHYKVSFYGNVPERLVQLYSAPISESPLMTRKLQNLTIAASGYMFKDGYSYPADGVFFRPGLGLSSTYPSVKIPKVGFIPDATRKSFDESMFIFYPLALYYEDKIPAGYKLIVNSEEPRTKRFFGLTLFQLQDFVFFEKQNIEAAEAEIPRFTEEYPIKEIQALRRKTVGTLSRFPVSDDIAFIHDEATDLAEALANESKLINPVRYNIEKTTTDAFSKAGTVVVFAPKDHSFLYLLREQTNLIYILDQKTISKGPIYARMCGMNVTVLYANKIDPKKVASSVLEVIREYPEQ